MNASSGATSADTQRNFQEPKIEIYLCKKFLLSIG